MPGGGGGRGNFCYYSYTVKDIDRAIGCVNMAKV